MKDFYSDHGGTFATLFLGKESELPEFVKTASFHDSRDDLSQYNDNAFGIPGERKFPMYDRASTYMSALYAKSYGAPVEVMDRIQKQAALFGIEDEVENMEKYLSRTVNPKNKTAGKNIWMLSLDDGVESIEVGGNGETGYKTACEKVLSREFITSHTPYFVNKVARALHDTGSERGWEVSGEIRKYAGLSRWNRDETVNWIGARSFILPLDKRAQFSIIAEKVASLAGDVASRVEVAETLSMFDRAHGLDRFYGSRFPDPLETMMWEDNTKVATIGGVEYPENDCTSEVFRKVASSILDMDVSDVPSGTDEIERLLAPSAARFNSLMSKLYASV